MKELIFASNNAHKIKELSSILENKVKIVSLAEAGIDADIPEPFDTLEENALNKARFIYEKTGKDCFADDSGLEINSLDGKPGVNSADYAGLNRNTEANIAKVLLEMENEVKRKGRFRAVFALIMNGESHLFEGKTEGMITTDIHGKGGFGYDPIFIPNGYSISFAEMDETEKNKISHRAKAAEKLIEFLKTH